MFYELYCPPFRPSPADIQLALVNLKQLVFEVTDACNLRCKYCVYGDLYTGYDQRQSQNLPFEDAKAVINYLVDLWKNHSALAMKSGVSIGFFGGEPLMNVPLIRQVISYFNELDSPKKVNYNMTSNCLLLDRYMDLLVENDFSLLCSLDGDWQADAYRVFPDGTPSFDKVYNNIKLLQHRYPDYFERKVEFNAVLHNLNNVQGVVDFFRKEFNKLPQIAEMNLSGIRNEQESNFEQLFRNMRQDIQETDNNARLKEALDTSDPEVNELMYYLKNNTGNSFRTYQALFSSDTEESWIQTGTCLPFTRKMFVKVDGKIMQCERIHHNFAIGLVRDGQIHLDYNEICNIFNGYLNKILPLCVACANRKICSKCLFTVDGIEGGHFKCNSFVTPNEYKEIESRRLLYLYGHPYLYRKLLCDTVLY